MAKGGTVLVLEVLFDGPEDGPAGAAGDGTHIKRFRGTKEGREEASRFARDGAALGHGVGLGARGGLWFREDGRQRGEVEMAKAVIVSRSGVQIEAATYSQHEPHDRALLYQGGRWVGDVACGEAYALERGPVLGSDDDESAEAYAALERALLEDGASRWMTPA